MTQVLEPPIIEQPIIDDNTLVIVITDEDIKLGKQRSPGSCAIALAAMRVVPTNGWFFGTHLRCIREVNPIRETYFYSRAARLWATAFDTNKNFVAPGRFVFKKCLAVCCLPDRNHGDDYHG